MLSRKKNLLKSIEDFLVESGEPWENRGAELSAPQLHRLALLSSCFHGHLIPLWPKGEERQYHRRFSDSSQSDFVRKKCIPHAKMITCRRSFLEELGFLDELPMLNAASRGAVTKLSIT